MMLTPRFDTAFFFAHTLLKEISEIVTDDANGCPSYLPHPYCQHCLSRRPRRTFHTVGGRFFFGSGGRNCLPAFGDARCPAKNAREPMAIALASYRHTNSFKRRPAAIRRRAARNGDGARRLVETPRSFPCHWVEPTAHRGCLCPTTGASWIGDNIRGMKQGFSAGGFH